MLTYRVRTNGGGLVVMRGCRFGSPCGLRTEAPPQPFVSGHTGVAALVRQKPPEQSGSGGAPPGPHTGWAMQSCIASAVHLIVLCRALCSRDSPSERCSPWLWCRRLVAALWRCWTSSAVWGNTKAAWSLLPRSKCDLSMSGPLIWAWSCWLSPQ